MRLIDAERLRALIVAMYEPFPNICNVNVILTAIDNAPTIEAEPVRHGKWIRRETVLDAECKCSVCGYKDFVQKNDNYWFRRKFCPNCGADMREVSEDAGTD